MTRLDPIRREYPDPVRGGGPKNLDAAARARFLQAVSWGGGAGALLGAAAGVGLADRTDVPLWGAVLLGVVVGPALIVGIALLVTEVAGGFAARLHAPPGGSRRGGGEMSRAWALAAAGEHERAAEAFRGHIADDPSDPGPHLALARLHRDGMQDPVGALLCFNRALREAEMGAGLELLVLREAVELVESRGLQAEAAAPFLSRLAERYPGRAEGARAREELARLKRDMRSG